MEEGNDDNKEENETDKEENCDDKNENIDAEREHVRSAENTTPRRTTRLTADRANRIARKRRQLEQPAERMETSGAASGSMEELSRSENEEIVTQAPGDDLADQLLGNSSQQQNQPGDAVAVQVQHPPVTAYSERMSRKMRNIATTEERGRDNHTVTSDQSTQEETPGAFATPGRAFGAMPAWAHRLTASVSRRRSSTPLFSAVLVEGEDEKEQYQQAQVQVAADIQEAIPVVKPWRKKHILHAAVDEFYDRILNDVDIMPFFVGINMNRLKFHQYNFMSIAFSEIPADMNVINLLKDKHARLFDMGLSEKHFDIVVSHFVETLEDLGCPQDWIDEAVQDGLMPKRPIFVEGAKEAKKKKDLKKKKMAVMAATGAAIVGVTAIFFMKRRLRG